MFANHEKKCKKHKICWLICEKWIYYRR